MPPPAPRPRRSRSTGSRSTRGRSTSGAWVALEVAGGLLLGAVLGWVAGLVRVRTPGSAA